MLQLARALWPGEAVRRAAAGASLRAALPVRGDHVQHTPRPLRRIARGQAHYVGPAESHGEKTAHSCVSRNPSNQCNPRDPCRSSTRWRLQKTPTPGPHSSTARARSCSRTRTAAIGCCKTKYKSLWICAPSALPIQPPTHNRPADSPTHPVKPLDTPVRRDAGKKKTDDLLELYNKVLKYRQFLEPPLPPPPPFFPPPLPALPGKNTAEWPPAPPMNVSPEEQVRRFMEKQHKIGLQISELVKVVSGCIPSKTTTCGLPANEAPDPWLARDGNKCRGYDTRSVAALDFCGYWDARSNPEGADPETRRELLDAGPVCLDKRGSMLTCSASSTRTQRAGVYELNYAVRPDRAFCDFPFFRSRLTAEARTSLECRQMLSDRNVSCHTGCDTCTSVCTNPGLRGIAAAWKCSAGQPIFGTFAASVVSDAGFDTRTRHGSDRRTGRPSIPASIWKEQFALLVNNDINYPRVPRNSVSCRKAHSTDSFGAYTSPIDERGSRITRVGHHVPCKTSSQCHSRCGEHPILGESYVCVKNARLYSYQGVNSSGSVYYIDEPGDDKFDVKNTNLTAEWLGTCMGARCAWSAGGRL